MEMGPIGSETGRRLYRVKNLGQMKTRNILMFWGGSSGNAESVKRHSGPAMITSGV